MIESVVHSSLVTSANARREIVDPARVRVFPRGVIGTVLNKFLPVAGVLGCAIAAAAAETAIPATVQFNRDVRPVMANTCFKCHGPDIKGNKSDLRLDLSDEARRQRRDKTGRTYTPIVPGNAAASEVWRRISSSDSGQVMPPPDSLHLLSSRDKEIIRRWIDQGATYEPHWSYIPPKKVALPSVGAGARNPIDNFILKELADRGIAASPEADRRTLIRRLSFDLTGLPPTVAETEAFVADTQDGAFERLVDRLLASPHYGERMAVGWLDLVRFADTVGYHGDQQYNNFPYRDYVIDAFNQDKPFDQFTREQIAGDLMPAPADDLVRLVATGFNRLNMVTREGGAQPKEYLARYSADRVRTVATAWLGSTMGCAECHDHKYDPFKTRDFYAMSAYFADIKQWGVYADYDYTPEPELKGFTNDFPFLPQIEVNSPYLQQRLERLVNQYTERVASQAKAIAGDAAAAQTALAWAQVVAPSLKTDPTAWTVATIAAAKPTHEGDDEAPSKNAVIKILDDQSARFEFSQDKALAKKGSGAEITLTPVAGPVARLRLEAIPDEMFSGRVTNGNSSGFFSHEDVFSLKVELSVLRPGMEKPEQVKIADAYAEQESDSFTNGHVATSVTAEWRSPPKLVRSRQAAEYVFAQPFVIREGDKLIAKVTSKTVARIRFSFSPLGVALPELPKMGDVAAAITATAPTPEQIGIIAAEYFRGTAAGHSKEYSAMLADVREIAACRGGRAWTTVTAATTPMVTRVLPRGNWQDESGPIVQPAPPGFLMTSGQTPAEAAPRQNRLDLANWLVSRENPLTARAFMNRLWRQFFGTGLSTVVDDLGIQGEYPSHPELLDWLAVDFMDRQWDVKAMVRLIVTSATYRQSSRYRPELAEVDPNNRLLARQTPRRLEAEFVRDNALATAGLINLEIGGPSVFPYQPEGYYAALQFPDRQYVADTDERQYRRGVYMHWQRTFLHPMLANFDAPSREECSAARMVSSTPQQALTVLNDPTFVEAARGLAGEVIIGSATGFETRLDFAFRRVLSRPANERERRSLHEFYDTQFAHYHEQPDEAKKLNAVGFHPAPGGVDPIELAAWTSLARVLLNLNEAIVRY